MNRIDLLFKLERVVGVAGTTISLLEFEFCVEVVCLFGSSTWLLLLPLALTVESPASVVLEAAVPASTSILPNKPMEELDSCVYST